MTRKAPLMNQVLYVEDSATSQLLMRRYLTNSCELTIASTPKAAEPIVKERRFDLIITDFLFPDGDALGLINLSRRSEPNSNTPIIVISSSMDSALLARIVKMGANEGMSKPLNTTDFRALVDRMLHAPYVRILTNEICSVSCFQWANNGKFHEFCPELNIQVDGDSRDEVVRKMILLLQEHQNKRSPLGYTQQEKVVTHMVQSTPQSSAVPTTAV